MAKGLVLGLTMVFVTGAAFATVLLWTSDDHGRPESQNGIPAATAAATSTVGMTPPATALAVGSQGPELFVDQVTGLRGCGQPVFVTAGGLPPRAVTRVERLDDPRQYVGLVTTTSGQGAVDGTSLFVEGCRAGTEYTLRLTKDGMELARASVAMPLFPGIVGIEPPRGGCDSIVVTVQGMPANSTVAITVTEAAPYAHNSFPLLEPPLVTNQRGFAQSAPFKAPWECSRPAVSLTVRAGLPGQSRTIQAELLYRIALGPDEPIPSVEGWLRGGR